MRVESEQLVAEAERSGDEALRYRALLMLAKIAVTSWELETAKLLIDRAATIECPMHEEDSLTFKVTIGEYFSKTHQVHEGLTLTNEVRDRVLALHELGHQSQTLSRLLWRSVFLTGIGLGDLGRHDEGLAEVEQLVGLEAPDRVFAAMLTANRALRLVNLGQPVEAVRLLRIAQADFAAAGAVAYNRLVSVHLALALARQGLFDQALTTMEAAKVHYVGGDDQRDWSEPIFDLDSARLVLVEIYWLMGATDAARKLLALALPLASEWNRISDVGRVSLIAAELAAETSPETAIEMLESLMTVARRSDDTVTLARIIITTCELVTSYVDDQLIDEAALTIEEQGSDVDLVRLCLLRADRGEASEAKHQLETARGAIQKCSDPNLLWQFHYRNGRLALQDGRHDDARVALQQAVLVLRAVWTSIPDERLRIRHRSSHAHVVEHLTEALLELGLAGDLFELIEETYGMTLRERVQGVVPASQWPKITDELNAAYGAMTDAGSLQWKALREQVSQIESRMGAMQRETNDSSNRSVFDGQRETSRQRSCLVYGICGEEVFGIFKRGDQPPLLFRHLTTTTELGRLRLDLELQRRRIEVEAMQPHWRQLDAITNSILAELYSILIGRPTSTLGIDAAEVLKERPGSQFVIVPPPGFDDLPFAAFRPGDFAVASVAAVCIAPSTSLAAWVAGRARQGRSTLAVGVSSQELQFPEAEARQIGELTGGRVLTGKAATIDALAESVSGFDVIHIATHGIARRKNPWFSGLQLADGWLTTAELSQWRLDGQIVVLSGCFTAHSAARGHELLGLPRALLAAGAGGVIASIADLDDETAPDFMIDLHQHLADHGPAEALRRTQAKFSTLGPDLRQWASMAYIGGPDRRTGDS